MTVSVTVDDGCGIAFYGRRQSRDAVLLKDFAGLAGDREIRVFPYSKKLFDLHGISCTPSEDPFTGADNSFIFCEITDISRRLSSVDTLIIYRWNRRYPADLFFNPDLHSLGFSLCESTSFAGKSHEKITREIYKK